jgi:hypothetical protein
MPRDQCQCIMKERPLQKVLLKGKMASIHCGGVLSVQIEADELRVKALRRVADSLRTDVTCVMFAATAVDHSERAEAVILQLEHPLGMIERRRSAR